MNAFNIDNWGRTAFFRRVLLFGATLLQTWMATAYLLKILPEHGGTALEVTIAALFAILFGWISLGFWTAVAGFFVLTLKPKGGSITSLLDGIDQSEPITAKTAIVVPICNEEVTRVFAGLKTTWQSLCETGQQSKFELFILSDSSDPDIWVEEEAAWARWVRESGSDQIHYRHRRTRIKRKTGNIADFLRRWGRDYRYMIVFDADSVMAGNTMADMVRLMERQHQIGILQTAPMTINRESAYARMQQFGNHVYGPLFTAGLNFWQMGDGYYWGHNAIIRVAPFIEHCGLKRLSGDSAMGGEILSHDFVEAAYMRRAGWEVWLAWDMPGSYEEPPPTLLDELKRDRRWSQGNLQHLRLITQPGIRLTHRIMFFYGMMAYGSSLLWLMLIIASTINIVQHAGMPPEYFPDHFTLYPDWSAAWAVERALTLLATTATLLFAPKILGTAYALKSRFSRASLGGASNILGSTLLETLLSALLAPIRMLFHSRYVAMTLIGRKSGWNTQQRDDAETRWRDALRAHAPGALLALIWAGYVARVEPEYLLWISPILIALVLAPAISKWTSSIRLGRTLRRAGIFTIPAERMPDRIVRGLHAESEKQTRQQKGQRGFTQAVVDPLINALHISLLPKRDLRPDKTRQYLNNLRFRALRDGPSMPTEDRMAILDDADSLRWLHRQVWQPSTTEITRVWRLADT